MATQNYELNMTRLSTKKNIKIFILRDIYAP